ncbi:proline-rich protein 36-like isoform X2 [Myiozetetes cayanensis]|uniref:proline-rich protein 36-like isoform X1 n=1 Tax=Myiozetetes cayanensis TaxID=478635 RepID=UPI00215E53E4|nr:proline-rich protein 36-like isoform X1 [Myiozetetes cayanensis]XP_050162256.1 proline-rich protein 36-like isoform X2 [Myiozetetes cayanensis]
MSGGRRQQGKGRRAGALARLLYFCPAYPAVSRFEWDMPTLSFPRRLCHYGEWETLPHRSVQPTSWRSRREAVLRRRSGGAVGRWPVAMRGRAAGPGQAGRVQAGRGPDGPGGSPYRRGGGGGVDGPVQSRGEIPWSSRAGSGRAGAGRRADGQHGGTGKRRKSSPPHSGWRRPDRKLSRVASRPVPSRPVQSRPARGPAPLPPFLPSLPTLPHPPRRFQPPRRPAPLFRRRPPSLRRGGASPPEGVLFPWKAAHGLRTWLSARAGLPLVLLHVPSRSSPSHLPSCSRSASFPPSHPVPLSLRCPPPPSWTPFSPSAVPPRPVPTPLGLAAPWRWGGCFAGTLPQLCRAKARSYPNPRSYPSGEQREEKLLIEFTVQFQSSVIPASSCPPHLDSPEEKVEESSSKNKECGHLGFQDGGIASLSVS